MSDPRNVAHEKKVKQEKEHHQPEARAVAEPDEKEASSAAPSGPAQSAAANPSAENLEKSVAVLSKLKEMEFHSRANLETLAGLTLTIDDELKQKEFSDPIGALYSAQDQFQTKIAELIQTYEAHVDGLKPSV